MRRLIVSLFALLGVSLGALPCHAAATLELYPTFESMGVIVFLDPADDPDLDATAFVEFRVAGAGAYSPAFPPDRVALDRFVGSLFQLTAGSAYDVRFTLSDPDAGPIDGVVLTSTLSTRPTIVIPPATATLVVSPTGTGTMCSMASPCALTQALATVRAGEEVVLSGGVYYTGNLAFGASGSPGAPIVVRSATGESAVLDGADPATFIWAAQGGGVYATTINVANPQVVADGQRLYPYASLADLQNLFYGVAGFFASGTTLSVRLPGDADPNGAVMEVARENVAFTLAAGDDFIAFVDLEFRNYGQGSYAKALYYNGGSDGLVSDCRFVHDEVGVGFKRGAARNVVQDSTFIDTSWLWPWDAHKASGLSETIATTFYDPATGRGNVIRRNTASGGFDGYGTVPSATAGTPTNETDVHDNVAFDLGDDGVSNDGMSSNVRIWGNTIRGVLAGVSLAPSFVGPTYVFRNVIHTMDTGTNQWPGTPLKLNSGSPGSGVMYFLHNTVDVVTAATNALHMVPPGSWSRLVLRNNILSATQYAIRNGNETQPIDFDYDCLYSSGPNLASWNGVGTLATLATLQAATGHEVNGWSALPAFVDPSNGDYRLDASSGCIDRGVVLAGLNDDYQGAGPDMGAFESSGGCVGTIPTGVVGNAVRATRSGASGVDLSWAAATVSPPNHVVFKTATASELVETPAGIGDEMLLATTVTTSHGDSESLAVPPRWRFYEVLPADDCGQTVYP